MSFRSELIKILSDTEAIPQGVPLTASQIREIVLNKPSLNTQDSVGDQYHNVSTLLEQIKIEYNKGIKPSKILNRNVEVIEPSDQVDSVSSEYDQFIFY